MNICEFKGLEALPAFLKRQDMEENAEESVKAIIGAIKAEGDKALRRYTKEFDKSDLGDFQVGEEEIYAGYERCDEHFKEVLRKAKENIEYFHINQRQKGFVLCDKPGIVLGQKVTPLNRVGIYAPGGTARYPSTVLMAAIPAKIAGVNEIILVTPPDEKGRVPDDILAAAQISGIKTIYKIGGAQAIAALAYGTESIPKVDKVVGPGNIYVATAKKLLFGVIDIDMVAGPSEILIIADEHADSANIGADLLSQAEHDELASAVLVTTSSELAEQVEKEVEKQLAVLPRKSIAEKSLALRGGIVLTKNIEEAVLLSNFIAPEHLELNVKKPFSLLSLVKNAGSIFLGNYTPEALGDYMAGPNHTLPTGGTAKFSSPLGVEDFMKRSSFVYYDKDALEKEAEDIIYFAEREGLSGHGRAVASRFSK